MNLLPLRQMFLFVAVVLAAATISCSRPSNANRGNAASANVNQAMPLTTPTPTPPDDEANVRKLVSDLGEALSRNDADVLDRIYSDGYVLVTATGQIQTKAEGLAMIRSGELKFDTVQFEEVSVRAYGNTAVALARAIGSSTYRGRKQKVDERLTLVAAKEGDAWRFISGQITDIVQGPVTGGSSNSGGGNSGVGTSGNPGANPPTNPAQPANPPGGNR